LVPPKWDWLARRASIYFLFIAARIDWRVASSTGIVMVV
jgi:hypothetical protein